MSNSNRNPKDLRSLVETCKTTTVEHDDIELLDETFKNLRNLTIEEKTEVGMLKSRIDEQSRLIMVNNFMNISINLKNKIFKFY
jgi:hypothetical protein